MASIAHSWWHPVLTGLDLEAFNISLTLFWDGETISVAFVY